LKPLVWPLLALAVGAAVLSGCGPTTASPSVKSQASQVQPIAGTKTSRVVLSAQAAAQLGIRTEPIRKATGAAGVTAQNTMVPTAAIVYEADGTVWVYAALPSTASDGTTGAVAYARQPVVVGKITGDVAVLQSGPPAGTSVVTVGAAELLGTESGVEGG
jgi:hypothetical protein